MPGLLLIPILPLGSRDDHIGHQIFHCYWLNCLDIAALEPGIYIHYLALTTSTLRTCLVWLSFLSEFVQGTCAWVCKIDEQLPPQYAVVELYGDKSQTITQPHPTLHLQPLRKQRTCESKWSWWSNCGRRERALVGVISPNALWIKLHQVLSHQTVTRIKHSSYVLLLGIHLGTLQEHACKLAH